MTSNQTRPAPPAVGPSGDTANTMAMLAKGVIYFWILLSLAGCTVAGFQSTGDDTYGTTYPFVWPAIGAGLVICVIGTFMLAVVEYIIFRTSSE